jgi:hypothetical protein
MAAHRHRCGQSYPLFLTLDYGLTYICHFGCGEIEEACLVSHYLEHSQEDLLKWKIDKVKFSNFLK